MSHTARPNAVRRAGLLAKGCLDAERRRAAMRRLRYPQAACAGALLGCLASVSPHAQSASIDRADSIDDGVVTLSGVLESSTITRHARRHLVSNPAGVSSDPEHSRAGLLPSTVQMTRASWNSDTSGAVGVDNVSYRMSYGTRTSALSIGVGVAGYSVQPTPSVAPVAVGAAPAGPLMTGTLPSVSVAYRHSFTDRYQLNMEATKAAAVTSQLQDSMVATKVGIEYKPARNSVIGLEQGSLNLNMGSSGNFAMKIRRGGPMFYLRSKF